MSGWDVIDVSGYGAPPTFLVCTGVGTYTLTARPCRYHVVELWGNWEWAE